MNSSPSDFTLLKGKVIREYVKDGVPKVDKFPDYIRVTLHLVLYPEGLLASWDRHLIDATVYDMVCNGVYHEAFSHTFLMRVDHFKAKFPNVPLPDESF